MRLDPPHSMGHRLSWSEVFRQEWDRVGFHFSSIGFGVWSIWITLVGPLPPNTPQWLITNSLAFDFAFLIIGISLFTSLRNGSFRMRELAYVIYVLALLVLTGLLLGLSRSPYGLLALGFVFQGINAIRLMRAQHRVIATVVQARQEDAEREEMQPRHRNMLS